MCFSCSNECNVWCSCAGHIERGKETDGGERQPQEGHWGTEETTSGNGK